MFAPGAAILVELLLLVPYYYHSGLCPACHFLQTMVPASLQRRQVSMPADAATAAAYLPAKPARHVYQILHSNLLTSSQCLAGIAGAGAGRVAAVTAGPRQPGAGSAAEGAARSPR